MVSFLSSSVTTGHTGTIEYILTSSVFLPTTRQLDAWPLTRPKTMWFSSLRLLACEAGRTLVKACKD